MLVNARFSLLGLLAGAVAACTPPGVPAPPASETSAPARAASPVSVVAAFDFPKGDERARELSGIAWEDSSRTLFAVSDETPWIVPLVPNATYDGWTFGAPIATPVADKWDGEGIAVTASSFFLANERGPRIYELARTGHLRAPLRLPPRFDACVPNKCIEALSLSPDQRFLFFVNESALMPDGPQPTADAGTTVRIVRRDRPTDDDVEWVYRTEPIFARGSGGDMGVSDVAALSGTELLVMERSFVPGTGASVRIFHVTLEEKRELASCNAAIAGAPDVVKKLVVDVASLGEIAVPKAPQTRLVVPNYEGMALGPALATGERILFLVSDDNGNPALPTRLLTLKLGRL